MAKDEPPAADPKAVEVIRELGLVESPTALRDQKGWRAPKRIVMASGTPYGELQASTPGVEIVTMGSPEEMVAHAANADAIVGGDNLVCDERVLAAAKKVRWVGVFPRVWKSAWARPPRTPGLTVTNMRAVAGPVMAEHTIALMFALSRSLQVSVGRQARAKAGRQLRGFPTTGAHRQTLLVAGLGGIGLEVARRAHALGMKVIATRNSSREKPDYVSYVGLADELPTLIGRPTSSWQRCRWCPRPPTSSTRKCSRA